jgi:hypothetical protein
VARSGLLVVGLEAVPSMSKSYPALHAHLLTYVGVSGKTVEKGNPGSRGVGGERDPGSGLMAACHNQKVEID